MQGICIGTCIWRETPTPLHTHHPHKSYLPVPVSSTYIHVPQIFYSCFLYTQECPNDLLATSSAIQLTNPGSTRQSPPPQIFYRQMPCLALFLSGICMGGNELFREPLYIGGPNILHRVHTALGKMAQYTLLLLIQIPHITQMHQSGAQTRRYVVCPVYCCV